MIKPLFFKKNRIFYYKLITTLLLISLLPVLFISVLSFYYTQRTIREELIRANVTNLRHTVSTVEIIMKQINDAYRE